MAIQVICKSPYFLPVHFRCLHVLDIQVHAWVNDLNCRIFLSTLTSLNNIYISRKCNMWYILRLEWFHRPYIYHNRVAIGVLQLMTDTRPGAAFLMVPALHLTGLLNLCDSKNNTDSLLHITFTVTMGMVIVIAEGYWGLMMSFQGWYNTILLRGMVQLAWIIIGLVAYSNKDCEASATWMGWTVV